MTMSHYVESNDHVTLRGMECIIKIIVEIAGNLVIERENSVLYITSSYMYHYIDWCHTNICHFTPIISVFHRYRRLHHPTIKQKVTKKITLISLENTMRSLSLSLYKGRQTGKGKQRV